MRPRAIGMLTAALAVVALLVVDLPAPAAAADVHVGRTVTTGLRTPWGMAFLPDGSALVSERDTGRIVRVPASGGNARLVGRVRQTRAAGEGGLLGLAVPPGANPSFVFAYVTTATDNRVLRIDWDGRRLGKARAILTGIPKGTNHNGGALLVGPSDTLFVGTGEIYQRELAQKRSSLGGKILRVTFAGRPAPGNPFPGSPVYSLGHRNVQGLAFDSAGRLWATEFGEHDADELNLIRAGGNYGWPVHEGKAQDPRYIDPVVQWSPTAVASPSGLAIVDDIAYVASLRGQRLWQVPLHGRSAGTPKAAFHDRFGRLRAVAAAPGGGLWLATSNTDGRGTPRRGDDRIVRVRLTAG